MFVIMSANGPIGPFLTAHEAADYQIADRIARASLFPILPLIEPDANRLAPVRERAIRESGMPRTE